LFIDPDSVHRTECCLHCHLCAEPFPLIDLLNVTPSPEVRRLLITADLHIAEASNWLYRPPAR
jgi:hypothetical protein